MKPISICKACGKPMFEFIQINNLFYVCINKDCKFEGLLKIDLKTSIENSRRFEHQYAI